MTLTGKEGARISRSEAQRLMQNYKNSNVYDANNKTLGILFGKDHLDEILAQAGCKGIRIYYGKNGVQDADDAHMILVGTDLDGNDMTNVIVDIGIPCPSHCSSDATKL